MKPIFFVLLSVVSSAAQADCVKNYVYDCALHVQDGVLLDHFTSDGYAPAKDAPVPGYTLLEEMPTELGAKTKLIQDCASTMAPGGAWDSGEQSQRTYLKDKSLQSDSACRDYIKRNPKDLTCAMTEQDSCS